MSQASRPRLANRLVAILGAVTVATLGVSALAIGVWRAWAFVTAFAGRYSAEPMADFVLACCQTPIGVACVPGTAYVLKATGCFRRSWDETAPRAYAVWFAVRLLAGVEMAWWLIMLVALFRSRV